jgi:hypothetical protein
MQHGPAASSGSNPKAPGSAGGYLPDQSAGERLAYFCTIFLRLSTRSDLDAWIAHKISQIQAIRTEMDRASTAIPESVDPYPVTRRRGHVGFG